MTRELDSRRSHWCIVVTDDKAPEWVPYGALDLASRANPLPYESYAVFEGKVGPSAEYQ
jgi:hypothetical protein